MNTLERGFYRTLQGLVALVVLVGALGLLGCESGGGEQFRAASAGSLENQVFTFTNGAAFGLTGQTVTLTFGDFDNDGDGNANTGPFTLQTTVGTATGTVTIGSCDLATETSDFDADAFPGLQAGQTTPLDPCKVNTDDGSLQVQNATTSAISTSDSPNPIPTTNVAFVLTEGGGTGSYSVVELSTRDTFNDLSLGGVHSDALARFFSDTGLMYVVNRLGVDSIQLIDPQQGFTTPSNAELSVGNGANPHDIAFVSADKAYISRFGAADLWIINPTTLIKTGEIDLSGLVKSGDLDGNPEMDRLLIHDGMLYVTLEHLDNFTPVAQGEVVVIDTATDTIDSVIQLNASNPFTDLQFSPDLDRILVSTVGSFVADDGGIEAIDPSTQTVDAGFVIDEAAIGGQITHFGVVSVTKGFAVILDSAFDNVLVSFNPLTGARLNTLFGPSSDAFFPHFAINRAGELYLAVHDDNTPTPSIRIFDTDQEVELTTEPLGVGALPPNWIVFIEE